MRLKLSPTSLRKVSYFKGLLAEYYAILILFLKGYTVVARRYKSPLGEIDIICRNENTLIFVEVKYRPKKYDGLFCINNTQYKRVRNSAKYFLLKNESRFKKIKIFRIDAIVVNRYLCFSHIKSIKL